MFFIQALILFFNLSNGFASLPADLSLNEIKALYQKSIKEESSGSQRFEILLTLRGEGKFIDLSATDQNTGAACFVLSNGAALDYSKNQSFKLISIPHSQNADSSTFIGLSEDRKTKITLGCSGKGSMFLSANSIQEILKLSLGFSTQNISTPRLSLAEKL